MKTMLSYLRVVKTSILYKYLFTLLFLLIRRYIFEAIYDNWLIAFLEFILFSSLIINVRLDRFNILERMNLTSKEIKAVYLKYFGLNLAVIFILVSLVDISFLASYFFIAFILIGVNDLKNSINRIRIHTEVNLEKLPSGVSLLVAQLMVIATARYYLNVGLPSVGVIALIAVIIYIVSSFIDSKYKERMKLNEV